MPQTICRHRSTFQESRSCAFAQGLRKGFEEPLRIQTIEFA